MGGVGGVGVGGGGGDLQAGAGGGHVHAALGAVGGRRGVSVLAGVEAELGQLIAWAARGDAREWGESVQQAAGYRKEP
jgi:hypothetical protein